MANTQQVNRETVNQIVRSLEHIDATVTGEEVDLLAEAPTRYGPLVRDYLRDKRREVISRAESDLAYLWGPDSPIVFDHLARLRDSMVEEGDVSAEQITDDDLLQAQAHGYAMVIAATNPEQRLQAQFVTSSGVASRLRHTLQRKVYIEPITGYISELPIIGLLGPIAGETTIEGLRNQMARIEAGGVSPFERLEYMRLRSRYQREMRIWIKRILNVSGIKSLAFAEIMKYVQASSLELYRSPALPPRMKVRRWALSPAHPQTDLCDLCANWEWIPESARARVQAEIAREIDDWRGVFIIPEHTHATNPEEYALVIPELADRDIWPDDRIADMIESYWSWDMRYRPDLRRKLAGRYGPHPSCMCVLEDPWR